MAACNANELDQFGFYGHWPLSNTIQFWLLLRRTELQWKKYQDHESVEDSRWVRVPIVFSKPKTDYIDFQTSAASENSLY